MTTDIRMRRAKKTDLPTIWKATLQTVWDDAPTDERQRLDRAAWERHFRKKIEPYVDRGRTEAWIAEDASGAFLGYVLLGPGGGFLTPEEHGFVYDVWVAPAHRGRGVGRHLVSWAVDWARGRGYRKIKLEVAATNAAARRIYERFGFRDERHHMGLPLDASTEIARRKEDQRVK
ncbi:MAG: GNAT family N-acetyltransferase [Methanobacteriota archaeon]